ncbi:small ribosomal subunit protein mS31-like [Scylla paramamosain]|uniref:small ribosomal subunit protein mS31-like n=1 Tax=Scylla paramamosain TaxID=85552 RepID=UPI003082F451
MPDSATLLKATRRLCEHGGGDARPAATVKNGETKEKSIKSQNLETQIEDHKPLQGTERKKTGESDSHVLKHESSVKEKAAAEKQDKKTSSHKKLHDLLSSLASPQVQPSRPKARKKTKTAGKGKLSPVSEPDLEPELVLATKEVAKSLGGDVKETESELLSTLRLHSSETTTGTAPSLRWRESHNQGWRKCHVTFLLVPRSGKGTTLTRKTSPEPASPTLSLGIHLCPGHSIYSTPHSMCRAHVDLFGGQPLGIFKKREEDTHGPAAPISVLPTWERLYLHELEQSMQHPPSNAFVEMIQWTKQGKLWTFPIDNEAAGLVEEMKVGFHEHVFLERHLEGWCPKRGPIRHFMELVCTGLSKNPHLEWYKNYFNQKENLLKELGAIEVS